jgi:hypothetical protein
LVKVANSGYCPKVLVMSKQWMAEEKDNISAKHRTEEFLKPIFFKLVFIFLFFLFFVFLCGYPKPSWYMKLLGLCVCMCVYIRLCYTCVVCETRGQFLIRWVKIVTEFVIVGLKRETFWWVEHDFCGLIIFFWLIVWLNLCTHRQCVFLGYLWLIDDDWWYKEWSTFSKISRSFALSKFKRWFHPWILDCVSRYW